MRASRPASALVPHLSDARDGAAWRRLRGLHALVLLAVIFNLWSLRFERLSVAYPNDSGMHLQMTTLAMDLLRHGISPSTTGIRYFRWARRSSFSTRASPLSSPARCLSSSGPTPPWPGASTYC